MTATVFGFVCDEPQSLGTVALKGERLHYHPSDRIPVPVLKGVKRGLRQGHASARLTYNGTVYRYQCDGVTAAPAEARAPKRNPLTGKAVYAVTVATNAGNRVLDFEADCQQDAKDAAAHLKLKVVDVQPA